MDITQLPNDAAFDAAEPAIRDGVIVRTYDNEMVAWAEDWPEPAYLDPITSLVFQMLDGTVTLGVLAEEVHQALGVPLGVARSQLRRATSALAGAQLLASDHDRAGLDLDLDYFPAPPNP